MFILTVYRFAKCVLLFTLLTGCLSTALLAQDNPAPVGDAVAPTADGAVGGAEAAAPKQLTFVEQLFANPLLPFVAVFFLFYVLVLAPERRRKAEEKNLINALQKNDRIVTIGGIHGTVVSVSADNPVITIRIDENSNTRMKINRTAVATVIDASKEKKESDRKDGDS